MVELMLKKRAVRRFNWLFPLSCQMPEIERKNLRQSCSIASKSFFCKQITTGWFLMLSYFVIQIA